MVNFVADNVGFNDVNLRNLKIEYTKAETVGGSETIKYPFDSLCFVANGTGFASSGGKTWRDLSRGETVYVKKNEEFIFVSSFPRERTNSKFIPLSSTPTGTTTFSAR